MHGTVMIACCARASQQTFASSFYIFFPSDARTHSDEVAQIFTLSSRNQKKLQHQIIAAQLGSISDIISLSLSPLSFDLIPHLSRLNRAILITKKD